MREKWDLLLQIMSIKLLEKLLQINKLLHINKSFILSYKETIQRSTRDNPKINQRHS